MPDREKSGWGAAMAAFTAMQSAVTAAASSGQTTNASVARRAMDAGTSVWNYLSNGGKILIPRYYQGATWEALGDQYAIIWLDPSVCSGGVSVKVSDPSTNYTCQCPREPKCPGCKSSSGREAWYDEHGLVQEVANVCPDKACFAAWRAMKIAQANAAGVAEAAEARAARRSKGRPSHSGQVLARLSSDRRNRDAADAAAASNHTAIENVIVEVLAGGGGGATSAAAGTDDAMARARRAIAATDELIGPAGG
jgi:hypothetical protein